MTSDRKYQIDDVVQVAPIEGDGCDYGTVIGYIDSDPADVAGTGPLYLVNVGNVFGHGGMWEYTLHESHLLAFMQSHAPDAEQRHARNDHMGGGVSA